MSKVDTWMPLYVGDYLADTGGLNAAQHGAYLLLIMRYWRTGPLLDDDAELARMACMTDAEWTAQGARVKRFFIARRGRLIHKRIDAERARANSLREKRAEIGRKGGEAKAAKAQHNQDVATNSQPNATILLEQKATPSPSPIPSKKITTSLPVERMSAEGSPTRAPLGGGDADFDAFWRLYPRRKEGPAAARSAWQKARAKAAAADILAGLESYPFADDPKYHPMPATWLNQGRWLHEADAPPPTVEAAPVKKSNARLLSERWGLDASPLPDDRYPATPNLRLVQP